MSQPEPDTSNQREDAGASAPAGPGRAQHAAGRAAEPLVLALHEHGIGFFLPPGGVLHASLFTLPHGALIEGEYVGDLTCEAGSLIIGASARVYGSLTADRIYIEGTVGSRRGHRSVVTGRALIAASAGSRINADMRSRTWSMHAGAQIWGEMATIEEGLLGMRS